MTMEELADKWIKQNCCECCVNKDDCDAGTIDCFAKQAFLAGYETLEKENAELKKDLKSKDLALEDFTKWSEARLTEATEILKVVLNKWKEERWILQSEKEVKMIENSMKEAEQFLEEE